MSILLLYNLNQHIGHELVDFQSSLVAMIRTLYNNSLNINPIIREKRKRMAINEIAQNYPFPAKNILVYNVFSTCISFKYS
jgi:hypothetical protein